MKLLNKREYKEKLEAIQAFHREGFKGFFQVWNNTHHPNKYIALWLYMLVECLIARELEYLNQAKNGNDNDDQ